jgi:hypothetical protein
VRRLLILLSCAGCGIDAESARVYEQGAVALRTLHVTLGDTTPFLAVDVTQTSQQNATAIQQQAMSKLGSCASVSLSGATVLISYASAGCGSGSISMDVVQAGGTVTLTETLSSVSLPTSSATAELVSGSITIATQNGSRLSVNATLDDAGGPYLGPFSLSANLTVEGSTVDGMTNVTDSDEATAAMFNAVVWTEPDCTPKGGSLDVTSGSTTETAKFDARTETTGQVQVVWAKGTAPLGFPGCQYQ